MWLVDVLSHVENVLQVSIALHLGVKACTTTA